MQIRLRASTHSIDNQRICPGIDDIGCINAAIIVRPLCILEGGLSSLSGSQRRYSLCTQAQKGTCAAPGTTAKMTVVRSRTPWPATTGAVGRRILESRGVRHSQNRQARFMHHGRRKPRPSSRPNLQAPAPVPKNRPWRTACPAVQSSVAQLSSGH